MYITTISEADNSRLLKWLSGEVEETIIMTEEYGRVILFHSSPDSLKNEEIVTSSRLIKKDGSILTCYSRCHSVDIQSRCILLTEGKVIIQYLGGYLFSVN